MAVYSLIVVENCCSHLVRPRKEFERLSTPKPPNKKMNKKFLVGIGTFSSIQDPQKKKNEQEKEYYWKMPK